jgi:hypothetical protein
MHRSTTSLTGTRAFAVVALCALAGVAHATPTMEFLYSDAAVSSLVRHVHAEAEGRIGNNAVNGTHEFNLGATTGAPAQTGQRVWGNNVAADWSLTWNAQSRQAVFVVNNETLSYTAPAAPAGREALTDVFIRARATANGTDMILRDVRFNGESLGWNVWASGWSGGLEILRLRGGELAQNWTLSGTATMRWTSATAPTNSNLAFQVKLTNAIPAPGAAAALALAMPLALRRRR